jgi:membrane-associated phospholipid phosphatase
VAKQSAKTRFIHRVINIGPAAIISFLVITLFFSIVYSKYPGPLIFIDSSISVPFFAMLALSVGTLVWKYKIVLFGTLREKTKVLRSVRRTIVEWLPFPLLLFVYENLKGRINVLTDTDYTHYLHDFDQRLFGFQPTVWLQKIVSPWLTDLLAVCYATYFIIPFVCVFLLFVQRRRREFHIAMTTIIVCFYFGYVGYITIPGVIPKFYLREVYTVPLKGYFLHQFMDKMYEKANAAEIWGAFPSLHIAVSSLGLILCYYFKGLLGKGRLLFWLMLPIVLGLWFSTVYLRYHWTIDIYAGWALSILAFFVGKYIVNVWSKFVKEEKAASSTPVFNEEKRAEAAA